MNTGVWHEVVVAVHWTTGNDGWYKTWWKRKGEANWTQTLDKVTNKPTFWWGWDYHGNYWSPESMGGLPSYQPLGLYTAGLNFPRTIWYDNYVEGTSFNAAASNMP
jgi:hypothetical protein